MSWEQGAERGQVELVGPACPAAEQPVGTEMPIQSGSACSVSPMGHCCTFQWQFGTNIAPTKSIFGDSIKHVWSHLASTAAL